MQADLSGNLHLLWRAGFGPAAEEIPMVNGLARNVLYKQLLKNSTGVPPKISIASGTFDGFVKGLRAEGKMQELSKEQKAQIRKENREALKNLNLRWLEEMVHSKAQMREKLAFFWHGHFACREINVFFQQQLLEIIRSNALSDFGTLLREVSKSAAMLAFLNNQQNRKKQPNENFARELMELFTLGRANYTEQDVKEAARAFTGWGFDLSGQFVFRKQFHDGGMKTIFGKSGYFDGDDVINMLLENKQTAYHISSRLYKFFVNEDLDQENIKKLASSFYQSGYNIQKLMDDIFLSKWFYEKEHIGVKIKSPVELIVGIRRMLPMEFQNDEVLLLYQRLLGQILFYPPNVAGWPGGKAWIDSSSLMYRLRLPRILKDDESVALKPKDDDDVMMGQADAPGRKQAAARGSVTVNIDWPVFTSKFDEVSKDRLGISIASNLLQAGQIDIDLLNSFTDRSNRESYIKTLTIQLMSLPEYQLM